MRAAFILACLALAVPVRADDKPAPGPEPTGKQAAAWISVGAAVGLATIGTVMVLSARANDDDIADLLVSEGADSPADLPSTGSVHSRYVDLVDQGDRYHTLAWISFGATAAAVAAATVLFALPEHHDRPASAWQLLPTSGHGGAGIAARVRF